MRAFPDAIDELYDSYDELIITLKEYALKNSAALKQYVIHDYNQISHEQKRIEERLHWLNSQDIKELAREKKLGQHQKEWDYYHEVFSVSEDAKAALVEHLAAYHPELFDNEKDLDLLLKELPPHSAVTEWLIQKRRKHQKTEQKNSQVPCLSLRQIALKHFYEGKVISKENAGLIVEQYGHTAGHKLYQHYTEYSKRINRIGLPAGCTKKKLQNKIELFESVIRLLDEKYHEAAQTDLKCLIDRYKEQYE